VAVNGRESRLPPLGQQAAQLILDREFATVVPMDVAAVVENRIAQENYVVGFHGFASFASLLL
jgi:hypothetical protein